MALVRKTSLLRDVRAGSRLVEQSLRSLRAPTQDMLVGTFRHRLLEQASRFESITVPGTSMREPTG